MKLRQMEANYDEQFQVVFEAIRQLLEEEEKPKRKIGKVQGWTNAARARRSGAADVQGWTNAAGAGMLKSSEVKYTNVKPGTFFIT